MKLSKETLNIIKNYASINSNLLLRKGEESGSVLNTISSASNIVSQVTVPEVFPMDFGIYDTLEFLGALSLFEDPELSFTSTALTIGKKNQSIKYTAADPEILTILENQVNFPEPKITAALSSGLIQTIQRTAAVLRVPDLSIVLENGVVAIRVHDKTNPSSNKYEADITESATVVGASDSSSFSVDLKVDYLKLIQNDYTIDVATQGISRFKATNSDLTYFIAIENSSTFNI